MKRSNITVRLLLSVDRSRGVDDAWSTLQLAKEYLTHVGRPNSSLPPLVTSISPILRILFEFGGLHLIYQYLCALLSFLEFPPADVFMFPWSSTSSQYIQSLICQYFHLTLFAPLHFSFHSTTFILPTQVSFSLKQEKNLIIIYVPEVSNFFILFNTYLHYYTQCFCNKRNVSLIPECRTGITELYLYWY